MPRLFTPSVLQFLVLATQAIAAEPSFDCGTAKTAREMATCRDARLATADREMAAAWQAATTHQDAATAKALRDDQRQFLSMLDEGFNSELWGKAGAPDSTSERRKAVAALRRSANDDTPETYALPALETQLTQRIAFLKALTPPAAVPSPFAGLWKNYDGELLVEPGVMATPQSAPDNNTFRVTFGMASFGFPKYQCHFAGVFKLSGDALLTTLAHNNDLDADIPDNLRIRRDGNTVTLDDDVPHQGTSTNPYYVCPRVPSLTDPLFHTALSAAAAHHLKPEDEDD